MKPPLTPLTPAALDALHAEKIRLQQELVTLRAEQQARHFHQLAAGWYGATAKHVRLLQLIARTEGEGSQLWADYLELATATMHAIRLGGVFTKQGSDQ